MAMTSENTGRTLIQARTATWVRRSLGIVERVPEEAVLSALEKLFHVPVQRMDEPIERGQNLRAGVETEDYSRYEGAFGTRVMLMINSDVVPPIPVASLILSLSRALGLGVATTPPEDLADAESGLFLLAEPDGRISLVPESSQEEDGRQGINLERGTWRTLSERAERRTQSR